MNKMNSTYKTLSETEIDAFVIADADDDQAWEEPVQVQKSVGPSLQISPTLAERAAFLAKLHRERSLEAWLMRIIEERVELEEGAFLQAKRELTRQAALAAD
jgi:hypothetical protein